MIKSSNMVSKLEVEHKRGDKVLGWGFTEKFSNGVTKNYFINFLTREVVEDIIYPDTNEIKKVISKNIFKYWYLRIKFLLRR